MCKYQISHDIKIGTENVEYMPYDTDLTCRLFFFAFELAENRTWLAGPRRGRVHACIKH